MFNRFFCLICCISLLHSAQAAALRVGIEEASPPKWQGFTNNRPSGLCPDLMELLEKADSRLHFEFPAGPLPQKRLEATVQEGALDLICGLARNPERESRFYYIDQAIYSMNYVLFARARDNVSANTWDAVRALGKDGLILLNYDSSAISRLKQIDGLYIDATGRTIENNLKKLLGGRGRFFYYHQVGGMLEIERLDLSKDIHALNPPMESIPFFLLAGKHVPASQRTMLLEALIKLEKSSELRKLKARWGLSSIEN